MAVSRKIDNEMKKPLQTIAATQRRSPHRIMREGSRVNVFAQVKKTVAYEALIG